MKRIFTEFPTSETGANLLNLRREIGDGDGRVARDPMESAMQHFLIKYRFATGSQEDWHGHIASFIAAIEADPVLNGRISYRCMKANNASGDYYHLASTADDEAAKALQERAFFKDYSSEMRRLSGGSLEVLPLAILAETDFRP